MSFICCAAISIRGAASDEPPIQEARSLASRYPRARCLGYGALELVRCAARIISNILSMPIRFNRRCAKGALVGTLDGTANQTGPARD
jgi:hypothetical protein